MQVAFLGGNPSGVRDGTSTGVWLGLTDRTKYSATGGEGREERRSAFAGLMRPRRRSLEVEDIEMVAKRDRSSGAAFAGCEREREGPTPQFLDSRLHDETQSLRKSSSSAVHTGDLNSL